MATLFSNALHAAAGPVANIRANAQFIEDTLVTVGGWAVTTDTGQTLPSALAVPTTNGQMMGYRIYAMTDSLSATYPVVMRVDFGSAQFGVNNFKFWVTIGMGSDGIGNITNKLVNQFPVCQGTNSSDSAAACNSYGSAGHGRVSLGLFVSAAAFLWQVVFCLERAKNAVGADVGTGLLLTCTGGATLGLDTTQYLIYGLTTQPATEFGVSFILSTQNPAQTLGGNVGVGVISQFRGIAQQPGTACVMVNDRDVPSEGVFLLTIYGVTHTYQQLGTQLFASRPLATTIGGTGTFYADQFARVAIRYD